MTGRKILVGLCTLSLVVSFAAGCGNNEEMQEDGSKMVQVTKIDGQKITAQVGTLTEAAGKAPAGREAEGTPPPAPEGGEGDSTDQKQKLEGMPPAKAGGDSGEKQDGTPPEKPDGNGDGSSDSPGGGEPPQGAPGGSIFEAGEGTVDFEINDSTKIILEQLQGEAEGTAEDIAEGAVLEITLEGDKYASKVVVRNLQAGKEFGGSETVSNGKAVTTIDKESQEIGETYESGGDDENALRVMEQ